MPAPQWDSPSRLLLIKSPFLLLRFVLFCQLKDKTLAWTAVLFCELIVGFLALQIYLNLTALVFAIWNVGASKAAGVHGAFLGPRFGSRSFGADLRGRGSDSRRSVCLHRIQRHRNAPLYLLVRVSRFAPQLARLFMTDLQGFDGHENFIFLDFDGMV
jgi:hypothetical protein